MLSELFGLFLGIQSMISWIEKTLKSDLFLEIFLLIVCLKMVIHVKNLFNKVSNKTKFYVT